MSWKRLWIIMLVLFLTLSVVDSSAVAQATEPPAFKTLWSEYIDIDTSDEQLELGALESEESLNEVVIQENVKFAAKAEGQFEEKRLQKEHQYLEARRTAGHEIYEEVIEEPEVSHSAGESWVRVKFSLDVAEEEKILRQRLEIILIVGTKPISIANICRLNNGDTRTGRYKEYGSFSPTFTGKEIKVGSKKTQDYTDINITKYWQMTNAVTASYSNSVVSDYDVMPSVLLNRDLIDYPYYEDEHSGTEMIEPAADLEIVRKEDREEWTSNDRKKYRKWYDDEYGEIDWDDIEIHHMIPRQYGGDNDYDNLIPLPERFHRKYVNNWWKKY